jgi:hypothetical protein
MANNPAKIRKPRRDCIYSAAEQAVMRPYRDIYQAQTTKEKRAEIFSSQILPDMFNYWSERGEEVVTEEESKARVLVGVEFTSHQIYSDHLEEFGRMDPK